LTGVAERRLSGEMEVEERAEIPVEVAEKTLDGGFEIGVSRSEENSNPGRFPRWRERGGSVVETVVWYMLQMYVCLLMR
jgi:hypothetical protein